MRTDFQNRTPLVPQTRPSDPTAEGLSQGGQPSRDSNNAPLFPQSKPLDMNSENREPLFPQSKTPERSNENRPPLFTQSKPFETTPDNRDPFPTGGQPSPPQMRPYAGGPYTSSVDPSKPTISNVNASENSDVKSEFYEPEERDIVLGAVISSNDDELELEIGAQFPAVMPFREFQPFPQIIENTFFKLPTSDRNPNEGFVAPEGRVLLMEDKSVNDGSYTEGVEIGTVVLAEVQGLALTDGRAILSCRLPARRLSWNRIAQVCYPVLF